MTHAQFAEFISQQGGVLMRTWRPGTGLIVQGEDAAGTRRFHQLLRKATRAGRVEVVTEGQLYRRLGLVPEAASCRLFSIADVARLVKVSGKMLRRWAASGLIQPHAMDDGVSLFRYAQLADARHLATLMQQGVAATTIRKELQTAEENGVTLRPSQLVHYQPQKLGYRNATGELLTVAGDAVEGSSSTQPATACTLKLPLDADAAIQHALDLEQREDYDGAVAMYEQILSAGPADEVVYFNLGNVQLARNCVQPAIQAYRKSLELDPHYAEAWNNLGNAYCDAYDWRRAIEAYGAAIRHAPQYDDAHFNLAETYLLAGRREEAREHYQHCLAASSSETQAAARARLDEMGTRDS